MSAKSVYEKVKEYNMSADFEHIDISKKVNFPDPLMLSVRKNPIGLVKRMFGSKEGQAVLSPGVSFDLDGQRVFNEMWTADKWLNDQVHSHTSIKCNILSAEFKPQRVLVFPCSRHGARTLQSCTLCSGQTR